MTTPKINAKAQTVQNIVLNAVKRDTQLKTAKPRNGVQYAQRQITKQEQENARSLRKLTVQKTETTLNEAQNIAGQCKPKCSRSRHSDGICC